MKPYAIKSISGKIINLEWTTKAASEYWCLLSIELELPDTREKDISKLYMLIRTRISSNVKDHIDIKEKEKTMHDEVELKFLYKTVRKKLRKFNNDKRKTCKEHAKLAEKFEKIKEKKKSPSMCTQITTLIKFRKGDFAQEIDCFFFNNKLQEQKLPKNWL